MLICALAYVLLCLHANIFAANFIGHIIELETTIVYIG